MTLRSPNRRHLLIGAAALTVPSVLAGCDQRATTDEQGRIRLRIATPGPARADHGGFYQAIATGLYAKRNLNIQFLHVNSSEDVSRHLASGSAELGLAQDSFAALRMMSDRAPVKAVAAFFQKDPRVVIARADGPRTLNDIGERPLFVEDADWPEFWVWMRSQYDLQTEQLARPDTGALAPFLEDTDSLLIGSLTREPAQVAAAEPDMRTRLLLPADDGYAAYGNLVLNTNAFARDNAEALRDFIAASIDGWKDYLTGDAEPAHALIRRANPATPQGSLDMARDLLIQNRIVDGPDGDPAVIGTMTEERWKTFAEQAQKAFSNEPDWSSAYTTQFLPSQG